jgi:hypothetical protein
MGIGHLECQSPVAADVRHRLTPYQLSKIRTRECIHSSHLRKRAQPIRQGKTPQNPESILLANRTQTA